MIAAACRLALVLFLLIPTYSVTKKSCWVPVKKLCPSNPLQRIYHNQNQCELTVSIPCDLRDIPYIIYPGCPEYNTARFNYNKRFNFFPAAIIKPRTNQEVAHTVSLLRKNKLPFSIRSGGHCYGPGSLSSGYIVDLSNFNKITINTKRNEVTIGAGCVLGDVIQALGKQGLAIPTGTCPTVGSAGLALGGGLGLLGRQLGATGDVIQEITLVTADSQIITVNKNNYPDLFWALRGAGNGSYGIVTTITYRLSHVPVVSIAQLRWPWKDSTIQKVAKTWQSWITKLPDTISSELTFNLRDGELILGVNIVKLGTEPCTEWQEEFKKLNPQVTLATEPYIDAAKRFAGVYTQPFSKAKSKFLFKPLPEPAIQLIIDYFNNFKRDHPSYRVYFEIGAGRGKIAQGDTAYFPRTALAWFFQFIYWNKQKQTDFALESLRRFYNKIEPYCSPYSYANLVDYDLGKTYLNAYYGTHVPRLIKIKRKYDPTNLFNWRQSIPLAIPTS